MNKLKELRISKNLTQIELSKLLNIPKRTIENWENGLRVPKEYLIENVYRFLEQYQPESKSILPAYKEHGYLRVATGSIEGKLGDPIFNADKIIHVANQAAKDAVEIIVFPELCLTGKSIQDLFFLHEIQEKVEIALESILQHSKEMQTIIVFGHPLWYNGLLYNVVSVVHYGEILGIVPKTILSYQEKRQFTSDLELLDETISFLHRSIPFGTDLIFISRNRSHDSFMIKIGEDALALTESQQNANLVLNPCATSQIAGQNEKDKLLIKALSLKNHLTLVTSNGSSMESSQDVVYSWSSYIYEDGELLIEEKPFNVLKNQKNFIYTEVDTLLLLNYRKNHNHKKQSLFQKVFYQSQVEVSKTKPDLTRKYNLLPFIKEGQQYLDEIINIMTFALIRRMRTLSGSKLVIGVSGGLDSTIVLLIAYHAVKLLELPLETIYPITMPAFGTSARTKGNAIKLINELGLELKTINITAAITTHLNDLEHPLDVDDITFENAQARERTQILMDKANMIGGFVLGTGDLSEIALGWNTYNGDHMSMYNINASIPKTLIPPLLLRLTQNKAELREIIKDIIDTPISPELTLIKNNKIQSSEEQLGPYQIHDFIIYHYLLSGFSFKKIYYLLLINSKYSKEVIKKTLIIFIRRFFTSQFKRNAMPDGVKATMVSLSAREDYQIPSDFNPDYLIEEIAKL